MAHKNLSHLTEQQIKDLIERYYNNEKIADLLKEFEINIYPSMLVKLFPPVVHNKLFCKYCLDVNLVSEFIGRSYTNGDSDVVSVNSFCPLCNHIDHLYCSCSNCKEIIKQKRQAEEEDKRNMLMQAFLPVNIDIPAPNELTLKDAVYLFAVKEHSATKDLEFTKPYLEGRSIASLAPDEELRWDIIEHLNRSGFIRINPLTNSLDAFKFDSENKVVGYYRNKILWEFLPNMDIGEKEEYLNSVRNIVKGEWSSSWEKEVSDIWHQIAKYECMENFKYLLKKHEFSIDQYGEKEALEAFDILLLFFSVGQVFNLSWQTVRDVQYYISLKNDEYDADNIVNIIINNIHKKVSKALEEKWTIKNSKIEYRCLQSAVSSTFFDLFLEIGDEYYENVMPVDYHR